jgi:hypothetical protein
MPVYFIRESSGVGKAVFRPTDDAEDVFCCAVALDAYADPQVRERFAELAAAAADYYRRTHVASSVDPAAWIAELPCAKCDSPLAVDVLHRARQAASINELGVTGGGYVAGCCRSRVVGVVMGGGSAAPRAAARR